MKRNSIQRTSVRDARTGRVLGIEQVYTDEDLIGAILVAKEIAGKTPTFHQMKSLSRSQNLPHPQTIQKRFGSWENAIATAGLSSNKYYDKDFLVKEIERFITENGHVPSTNEFRHTKNYPSTKAYKRLFGSFNNALVELGYTPISVANKNKYCCNVIANDGHICDSMEEGLVDNFLFANNIAHSIQPLYPRHEELNPKGYIRADFYLTDFNVFVEYAGLITRKFYASKLEKKQQLATVIGINLLIVYPSKLGQLEKIFKMYINT